MTPLSRLVSFVPLALIVLNGWAVLTLAAAPSIFTAALLIFTLYFAAPVAFRVHDLFRPLNQGVTRLDAKTYSPWMASHQFQALYDALPGLEALLRLVPGAYSIWLRLWGSTIGYGVQWPARMTIADRPLLDVGNRASFAPEAALQAHLIRRRGSETLLLVKRVHIGDRAQVGQGVRIGPGARVPKDAVTPARIELGVNQTFGGDTRHATQEEAQIAADPGASA